MNITYNIISLTKFGPFQKSFAGLEFPKIRWDLKNSESVGCGALYKALVGINI